MNSKKALPRKLLTGRWLIGHILVLFVVIILINLGLWQLRRLEQRRALNATVVNEIRKTWGGFRPQPNRTPVASRK